MFDDEPNSNKDDRGQKKPPGGFKIPTFTWMAWIAIIGGIVTLMVLKTRMATPAGQMLTEAAFLQKFNSNQVSRATITYNPSVSGSPITIIGKYFQTDKDG